jgi:hypothetical protein
MPIFISYSQKDAPFVEGLAKNLVAAKHNVWIDRWELNVGDSLTQKIQRALTDSSAMLVILSRNSVGSEWCKRELSAGLIRELEERKTLVMPCVIDDCDVPLFLRDKLYADFRKDADAAFDLVDRSLAKISNPQQGRIESPKFHTDWSIDWKSIEGQQFFTWTFIDHGHDWPYVILSECNILCDKNASRRFLTAKKKQNEMEFITSVLEHFIAKCCRDGMTVRIQDAFEQTLSMKFADGEGGSYQVMIRYRRLGEDTGMDTLVHLDNNFKQALTDAKNMQFKPPA